MINTNIHISEGAEIVVSGLTVADGDYIRIREHGATAHIYVDDAQEFARRIMQAVAECQVEAERDRERLLDQLGVG